MTRNTPFVLSIHRRYMEARKRREEEGMSYVKHRHPARVIRVQEPGPYPRQIVVQDLAEGWGPTPDKPFRGIYYLHCGHTAPRDAQLGDEGIIEYVVSPSRCLWHFRTKDSCNAL